MSSPNLRDCTAKNAGAVTPQRAFSLIIPLAMGFVRFYGLTKGAVLVQKRLMGGGMNVATVSIAGERRAGLVDRASQTVAPFVVPVARAVRGCWR
jgi:hypothetical protein